MSQNPASIYAQLGTLITNRPPLEGLGNYGQEQYLWLGRISALVEETGDILDNAALRVAIDNMTSGRTRSAGFASLMVILYKALARAELAAPANARGAFIDVGQSFTALQAVTKVFASAHNSVLVIDPYLNSAALFDFMLFVSDGLSTRLLCDSKYTRLNAELKVGVEKWRDQFASTKPIEARTTAPRVLHDRLIIVDEREVWNLSQSLKDMAERSPASLVRSDEAIAEMKISAYTNIWSEATVL